MGFTHRRRVPRARSRYVRRCAARRAAAATVFVVAVAALAFAPAPAAASAPAEWQRPVDGAVDFAAAPDTAVRAAGAGTMTFAGDVAGSLHVVVLHRNGLRTSYSFLLD